MTPSNPTTVPLHGGAAVTASASTTESVSNEEWLLEGGILYHLNSVIKSVVANIIKDRPESPRSKVQEKLY